MQSPGHGRLAQIYNSLRNRLVEYNEDDFAKFLRADAPDGLGTTIDRLKRIWIATDSEDGRKALVILEKLDSSARVRRRDSSEH